MKEYHVAYVKAGQKPDWSKLEKAALEEFLWEPETDIKPYAQLAYNETQLFLRMESEDENIRATYTGDYDMVCEDSCLELYLCPMKDDLRSVNLEINPNGSFYLGFGYCANEHIRIVPQNGKELFQIKTGMEAKRWYLEATLPVDFLNIICKGVEFYPGLELRANFYECGDKTKQLHYISWNRIESEEVDFFKQNEYGKLIFDER